MNSKGAVTLVTAAQGPQALCQTLSTSRISQAGHWSWKVPALPRSPAEGWWARGPTLVLRSPSHQILPPWSGLDGSKCPRQDACLRLLLPGSKNDPRWSSCPVASRVKPRCLALHLLLHLWLSPLPPRFPQPLRTHQPVPSAESWAPSLPCPFPSHWCWDHGFANWVPGRSGLISGRALSTLFSPSIPQPKPGQAPRAH